MADSAIISAFAERERVVDEINADQQHLQASDQALAAIQNDNSNAKVWVTIGGLFLKVFKSKAVDILNAQREHHENVMKETQHRLQSNKILLQQLEADRQNKFQGYIFQGDQDGASR